MEEKGNEYIDELKKFVGKEVMCKTGDGQVHTGILKSINFAHLNVVLMTKDEKIIIKNPQVIRRQRSFKGEKK